MIRVVIVEDEYYVRKGLIQTFDWKSLDCEVVGEAANGRDGIEIVEEQRPDLVIVDIEMPVINGLDMVKSLRERQYRAEYIFLTGHQKFDYVRRDLQMEAIDYLLKPFRYEDLSECIRKVKIRLHKIDKETAKTVLLTENDTQAKNIYIRRAMDYVRDHYAQECTVTDVADFLQISAAYFCRLFKKETGYTFVRYLTHYRIHVAAGMLAAEPVKINDVAELTGFKDANYFSTTFRRIMNAAPSEYQELHKKW
jgi:two-component system response regulator YesN